MSNVLSRPPIGPGPEGPFPPFPRGGSGGTGGSAPTGGGVFNPSSNGQVLAIAYIVFYPCFNLVTGKTEYRTFDVKLPFNDPTLGSFYFWKIEELLAYRNPTVRTVIVTYKDVGIVNTVWTITAAQDDQSVISQSVKMQLGNAIPTNRLLAQRIDFSNPPVTGQLVQLSVFREANAGPLQIAKVVMQVEIEESTL